MTSKTWRQRWLEPLVCLLRSDAPPPAVAQLDVIASYFSDADPPTATGTSAVAQLDVIASYSVLKNWNAA
ncbi:MAG TPA: hypothetical protein DDY78_30240 [Planctomycetales bacterium]|nr:hypothetical protein [Planctomycetales bacterium]